MSGAVSESPILEQQETTPIVDIEDMMHSMSNKYKSKVATSAHKALKTHAHTNTLSSRIKRNTTALLLVMLGG